MKTQNVYADGTSTAPAHCDSGPHQQPLASVNPLAFLSLIHPAVTIGPAQQHMAGPTYPPASSPQTDPCVTRPPCVGSQQKKKSGKPNVNKIGNLAEATSPVLGGSEEAATDMTGPLEESSCTLGFTSTYDAVDNAHVFHFGLAHMPVKPSDPKPPTRSLPRYVPAMPPNPKPNRTQEKLCVVCWAQRPTWVCIPCGHLAMCKGCSVAVKEKTGKCPVCLQGLRALNEVFFS